VTSPLVELLRDPDPAALDRLQKLAEDAFPGQPFSIHEEAARPWTRLWTLSIAAGEPAAFLVGWHVADELHILDLATAPSARRRGFASTLLVRALAYAAEHRVRLLLLEVRRSNEAAIALYRKHGFSIFGIRKAYYADNDEDALEMAVVLDPATGQVLPRPDEPI
jgi:ribosomal-protein-alanine N-acetyltransferase